MTGTEQLLVGLVLAIIIASVTVLAFVRDFALTMKQQRDDALQLAHDTTEAMTESTVRLIDPTDTQADLQTWLKGTPTHER